MLSPLRLALLSWSSLRLLIDPTHLPSVFGLVDAINTPARKAEAKARLAAHPRAAAALVSRPTLGAIDVDALAALPAGTLGHAFAAFVAARGIAPADLTDRARHEDAYVAVHLYESHDIWHVVTGIGTTPLDEVELQAFQLAQMPWERFSVFVLGIAFVRAALGHDELTPGAVLDAVARGRALGRKAELFFGVDWATQWARPLTDVRRELGLEPPVALAA